MLANKPVNLAYVVPRVLFWVIGICGMIAIASASCCREVEQAPRIIAQELPVPATQVVPEPVSQPARVEPGLPAVLSDMKIQPGPCEGFPGTIQTIANICDDSNGSFFIRLNPSDAPNIRMAHLMERLRSFRLDARDRRILSVTPVTDTICIDDMCMPRVYGAFGRYEYILK